MRQMAVALFLSLMLFSCGRKEDCLKNGDLVFVGIPVGYDVESGSLDEAISSATGEDGALNMIHVGIAEVQADSVWIIDATTAHGVARRPLDSFLKESMLSNGIYPEFVVKRVQGIDADAAVNVAKTFCGCAYDLRFLPDNEDIYCSELVQRSYMYPSGEPVFESSPMNFKAADGTMPSYWENQFGQLGMEVPQGLPGTNPQKMSQTPCLTGVPVELNNF